MNSFQFTILLNFRLICVFQPILQFYLGHCHNCIQPGSSLYSALWQPNPEKYTKKITLNDEGNKLHIGKLHACTGLQIYVFTERHTLLWDTLSERFVLVCCPIHIEWRSIEVSLIIPPPSKYMSCIFLPHTHTSPWQSSLRQAFSSSQQKSLISMKCFTTFMRNVFLQWLG